ncbi:MAG: hypothetical protein H6613_03385 [Ignavibacteriales bacterium]|nr:hypothetical protein [Ignavibacteriales bacterium]
MVDMFNFPTSGVYRYGESEIKSDGSFNIFLKNPPSEYLRSLKGFDAVPTNQLEFSSPDVKGYMAFLKLFDEAKPNVIDNIICGNTIRKENVGEYDIYFVYSEGDFDITGVQRDTNEFMKIKTYYEYDIHFKKKVGMQGCTKL